MFEQNVLISGVSDEDYAAAPGVRSTEVKIAAKSSAHWQAYLAQPRADTPALRFGRLAHMAVLEQDRFALTVHARPSVGDARTAKARAELVAWRESLPAGSQEVSTDEMTHLTGMLAAAKAHPRLRELLRTGQAETSLWWQDEAHGVRCKARFDFLSATGVVVDIKTCMDASPEVFGKDMMRYSYPVSAACYLEGVRTAGVGNPDTFVLVAIEKTPPYGIGLYTLGSDVLDWGHQWRHHAMCNISRALRTGQVEGYSDAFQVLELPKWAPRPVEFGT